MSDWKVGEKHGDYEVIELSPHEAKFRLPNGKIITTPNIYQAKSLSVTTSKPYKSKPVHARKNVSEADLQAELTKAKAKLDAIKSKRLAG